MFRQEDWKVFKALQVYNLKLKIKNMDPMWNVRTEQ